MPTSAVKMTLASLHQKVQGLINSALAAIVNIFKASMQDGDVFMKVGQESNNNADTIFPKCSSYCFEISLLLIGAGSREPGGTWTSLDFFQPFLNHLSPPDNWTNH